MNKIAIYVLIILIYLGLAKGFSTNELGLAYIKNANSLSQIIEGTNLTAILIDTHATGFLIKTYYQKYKVIYGFDAPKEIIVRTSRKFAIDNIEHIGMSLFRRYNKEDVENTTPLPPGSLFVGDPSFGRWKYAPSGRKVWHFFKAYKSLPDQLGWQKFRPTKKFSEMVQSHIGQSKPFFGEELEFGTKGYISRESFPDYFERLNRPTKGFRDIILEYVRNNF